MSTDTTVQPAVLTTLAPLVEQVTKEHADLQQAKTQQTEAEVSLLGRVLELVRPALPALAERIEVSWEYKSNSNGVGILNESTYHDLRGVLLVGDRKPDLSSEISTGIRRYSGGGVWLLTDGSIVDVTYSGTHSAWVGSGSHYEATVEPMTLAEVCETYNLGGEEGVVTALVTALNAQVQGSKTKRAAQMRERTARLLALVALL